MASSLDLLDFVKSSVIVLLTGLDVLREAEPGTELRVDALRLEPELLASTLAG